MNEIIIHENVVSNDVLRHENGVYTLDYFIPATPWTDKKYTITNTNFEAIKAEYEAKTHRLNDVQYACGGPITTRDLFNLIG